MTTARLIVERAGLFDTVQDRGRIGFQELGMPIAGAMDRIALALANALAGNAMEANVAALEMGVLGPTLRVEAESVRIGLVGPIEASLIASEGATPRPLPSDRSHTLTRGQRLKLGGIEGVSTAYLAVEGGIAVPLFMGSRSTYTRAGLGGLDGRKLKEGDALPLGRDTASARTELALATPFDYGSGPIRVVPGPQADHFTEAGHATFTGSEYIVSKEADRMGIRFDGPRIEHSAGTRPSSPTASRPARSRCRRPACRSPCSPTARPWAAIPRSPRSPRPTCRAPAACCRACACASRRSPSPRPRRCAATRNAGWRPRSPGSSRRCPKAAST